MVDWGKGWSIVNEQNVGIKYDISTVLIYEYSYQVEGGFWRLIE
jgi:hypothetical protein